MNSPWGAHLHIFLILVVACVIAWAAGGVQAALVVAVVVLAALLLHHLRHIALLARWLRDPDPETVPPGHGLWDGVFGDLYRMLRRQRLHGASHALLAGNLRRMWRQRTGVLSGR
jgi:two-component system phosphate regulon sensor histidine kinase PhoR